jgi:hypothetical protein
MKRINGILLGFIVTTILLISCGENKTNTSSTNSTTQTVKDNKAISGLMPVDVYLNMEKQGFTTTKSFSGEYGNTWESKYTNGGIEYIVSVFSTKSDTVESITATARLLDLNKNISETKQFLKYVCSVPYENSNPSQVASWIDTNFSSDKVGTSIGGVKFEIFSPSKFVRMIVIEKQK